jgi:hypothetical protein
MLIKSCLSCKFHEIKEEGGERISRCLKENCYARYSKCIAQKALENFLRKETTDRDRPFSALTQTYSLE